jgi:hypothetical protein
MRTIRRLQINRGATMKKTLLLLVLVLSIGAAAQQQLQRTDANNRTILHWVEPDAGADYYSWVYYSPLATSFTAPFDCRLVGYRVYWNAAAVGDDDGEIPFQALLYADDDGRPTGGTLLSRYTSIPAETGWHEVSLADDGVSLEAGEVFHPAWVYGEYDERQELVDPGAGTGLTLINYPGSGACWYTDDPQGSASWENSDHNYCHLVEAIIEPAD